MGYDFPLFPIADNPEYLQMMKRSLCPLLIPLISMCVVSPTFVSAEVVTCADHSIVASAVRTPGDVEAFVQCAYEYVQEEGFEEARRAFNEDERWRHGPIYVFVSEVTPMTEIKLERLRLPARPAQGRIVARVADRCLQQRLLQGTASYRKQRR